MHLLSHGYSQWREWTWLQPCFWEASVSTDIKWSWWANTILISMLSRNPTSFFWWSNLVFFDVSQLRSKSVLLLSVSGWMSVSVSEAQKVVQPGEEVTLTCINITTNPSQTEWFRVTSQNKPSCIASMYGSEGKASPCVGFQDGFEMSSNSVIVVLKINQVDLSHSGLYFCGFYIDKHTILSNETLLIVQGKIILYS